MKEQADIAQKAGYNRHDDTLPLVVTVRGQRSDICWVLIVFLLGRACPRPCWKRVQQTGGYRLFFILLKVRTTQTAITTAATIKSISL